MSARVTTVMRSELRDSWLPADYMDGPVACSECGFAPKRPGLLRVSEAVAPLHPLARSPLARFVCVSEEACERRRSRRG